MKQSIWCCSVTKSGFSGGASGKEPSAYAGDVTGMGLIPASEDPLEEGMATHPSIVAWRIPQTEERGGLSAIGSQRVGHN